ncbi:hypothetical protein [Streptomyces chattanoogensis]|uniref:hypothetical protein n=1 Tax=Streptomyces chattanoogensis TaxID=66876 RepID=UPI0036962C80
MFAGVLRQRYGNEVEVLGDGWVTAEGEAVKDSSVLAHLAFRFHASKETLATEALTYLAQDYATVRATLTSLAGRGRLDQDVAGAVLFRGEARLAGDDGIPDLAGQAGSASVVLIEGKFRAGLTSHQPVTYLQRLAVPGTLLFVCPSRRVSGLMQKASRRAAAGGFLPQGESEVDGDGIHWQNLSCGRHLAVTGWLDLLRMLESRSGADEQLLRADIGQLRGLVKQFEETLVEWRPEQLLTPDFGEMFEMGIRAAEQAAGILKEKTGAASKPRWVVAGNRNYVSFADVGGFRLVIGFSPADWGRPSPSPLYFCLSKHKVHAGALEALYEVYLRVMDDINARLRRDFGNREFGACAPTDEYWWGPLPLAFGVSELEGHDDLRATIARIIDHMTGLPSSATSTQPTS